MTISSPKNNLIKRCSAPRESLSLAKSESVGKSSIMSKFTDDHFPDYYNSMLELEVQKSIYYNGMHCNLSMKEVIEEDKSLLLKRCSIFDAVVMVIALNDRDSLEFLSKLTINKPSILVGNKSDILSRRYGNMYETIKRVRMLHLYCNIGYAGPEY